MKTTIRHLVALVLTLGALTFQAHGLSITTSISSTSANTSQSLLLFPRESLTYTLTGTATGQIVIDKSMNNSEWFSTGVSVTGAGTVSSTGKLYSDGTNTYYRFRRASTVALTSGTFVCVMADNNDLVQEFKNNKGQPVLTLYDDSITYKSAQGSVSPAEGDFGEYKSSYSANVAVSSNAYVDAGAIVLSPGIWTISAHQRLSVNSAPITAMDYRIGISTVSGNSSSTLVTGDNSSILTGPATGYSFVVLTIPNYRVSLLDSVTYYLKSFMKDFPSGSPFFTGKITAERR